MKVLIADDENLARLTLRSMLLELPLSLELLEDASDGEEMVELVQRYAPQVVFVDIKMPKLNGLEAIKAAKIFAPDSKWFILTGFSEFNYAQEALRLGVSDYLLKPVDPQELTKIMTEVIHEQQKRLAILNKQFEREIASLIHGLNSIEQEDRSSLLLKAHFIGTIFSIDSFLPEAEKSTRQKNFLRHVQAVVDTVQASEIRIALFALPSGEIALIGAWDAEHGARGEQLCYKYLHLIEGTLENYQDRSFCITMLQTSLCRSYDELSAQLHWLQQFSTLRALYGIGKKVHFKELSQYEASSNRAEISLLLGKLSFYHREKMYMHYMQAVDGLTTMFSERDLLDYGTKRCVAHFLCHALPCQLTSEQSIDEWKRELQSCGEQMLRTWHKKDNGDILAQVILFLEQHYRADIGIAQIAEKLHVTPNYLSTLFHKKTGMTFMKYLTRLRMLKARELLSNPVMQVQQVAEEVGYYSVRHFTKVFTAYFGYYPSEQRHKS